MTAITWLHLTDLHIGSERTRQQSLQPHFLNDLGNVCKTLGTIDLVLLTGDLVQRGAESEFLEADKFVQTVLSTIERAQSEKPVFLAVPGNHDLERPNPVFVDGLVKWGSEVEQVFWTEDQNQFRTCVEKALQNYENWWAKRRADCKEKYALDVGFLPGDFRCTFEKDGAKIGIVGLNTTFLQLTDDTRLSKITGARSYEGELVVSAQQYLKLGGRDWAQQHHLCLLLTHHPLAWLAEDKRVDFNRDIFDPGIFAAHLFGHMHEARYWREAEGGGDDRRSFQGKSLFGYEHFMKITNGGQTEEVERLHGYAIGRIEFNETTTTLRIWPRRAWEPGRSWTFGPDYESYALGGEVEAQHTKEERVNLRTCPVKPAIRERIAGGKDPSLSLVVKEDRTIQVEGMPSVRGRVELSDPVLKTVLYFRRKLIENGLAQNEQQLLGELLFHALFNGELREILEKNLRRVSKPGGRLRLNLNFGEARELAGLPWEYMYLARRSGPGVYLSSDTDISLSRLCLPVSSTPPVSGPLKIVVVVPKPDPSAILRSGHCFNECEVLKDLESLAHPKEPQRQPRFVPQMCDPPNRTKYIQKLEEMEDEYMLHFIGYAKPRGEGEEEDKKLAVAFLPETDKPSDWNWMSEDDFVRVFERHGLRIPRLVLLQLYDCPARHIASLAQRLITTGVPFVVAMQHPIQDEAAKWFSKKFYEALAEQLPVAAAVQAGRAEIIYRAGQRDLGTPVIYMSADSPLLGAMPPEKEDGKDSPVGRRASAPSSSKVAEELPSKVDADAPGALRRRQRARVKQESVDNFDPTPTRVSEH